MTHLRAEEVEELLTEWGAYVRTYRHLQGRLHRNTACLVEAYDEKMTRPKDVVSNPTLSNILAEERADLRIPVAMDQVIGSYPHEWRLMLVLRYVGQPIKHQGHMILVPMSLTEIDKKMELPTREREAAMRMLRRQLRRDLEATLPPPAVWHWVQCHRVG